MPFFLGFPAALCEGISLISEETILSVASAHRKDKTQVAVIWHLHYPFVQKVKNAAETSVAWAGPQNLLAELNSAPSRAISSTVPRSPSKLSDHHLERCIVTACSFTPPDAAARSWYAQGGSPTLGMHHGEMEPSHPPLLFGIAQLWDSLNQTCRAVWPYYARRRHKRG